MMQIRILIILTIYLFLQQQAIGQNREVHLFFKSGNAVVNPKYMNNYEALAAIDSILSSIDAQAISSIVIKGYVSPEGGSSINEKLSLLRAENSRKAVLNLKPGLTADKITVEGLKTDWEMLRKYVENSEMLYKNKVLNIINRISEDSTDNSTAVKELMTLEGGRPWNYMLREFFPYLRTSVIITIGLTDSPDSTLATLPTRSEVDTAPLDTAVVSQELSVGLMESEPLVAGTAERGRKLVWDIKTNTLLLAVGVSNIAAELRLSPNWSLNLPFVYSPYTVCRNWKVRILAIQPEMRYWFNESMLAGHFMGLNANAGFYNIAINAHDRYQDREGKSPLWSLGLTYGYSWRLSKKLALEFLIGAGYANVRYDLFANGFNGVWRDSGQRDYWGITNLGVSLSYKFNTK